MADGLAVLTMATEPMHYLPQFQRSCGRNGIDPVLLGQGLPWTDHMMKFRLLADWLDDRPGHRGLILWVDGYDCVLQRGHDAIMSAYHFYGRPFLFSAEQGPGWPIPASLFPRSDTPFRGICAGVWMAPADRVRQMLDVLDAHHHPGLPPGHDQGLLQAYVLSLPQHDYAIDTRCRLAQTLSLDDPNRLVPDGTPRAFRNELTNSIPCILHGAAGYDMTEIMAALDLPEGTPPPAGQKLDLPSLQPRGPG